jgi:lipoate---protein ligase
MNQQQYWRFIPPIAASGKVQMAIDDWLLEKHKQGNYPPTLRFYTWTPAAISCGYHQKEIPSFWQELDWQGEALEIVCRSTGGQAVLHQGDLTYAIVTSASSGKRLEVYKNICQFLIEGWRSLGVELKYGTAGKEYAKNPNCFATSTIADLMTLDGKKAIGSAQLRRGKAILQHGSMSLSTNANLFDRVFQQQDAGQVRDIAPTNLFNLITNSENQNESTIINCIKQAAENCFQIELHEQPLAESEWNEILKLKTNAKIRI